MVVVALGVALPRLAFAQDPDASASVDAEARSLFEAGRTAFRDGRFEAARDHFQHAYDLSQRPELLYNIASANDRLRNDAAALADFERYLEEVPDAPNRAEVEARIVALRRVTEDQTTEGDRRGEPVPVGSSGSPTVLWTWVSGSVALAAGALAVGFWVAANDQYASLAAGCRALGACSREEVAASGIGTSLDLTNVFFVSSLVLVGVTAIVLPLELTTSSPSTSVALRVGPGSLAIEGTF